MELENLSKNEKSIKNIDVISITTNCFTSGTGNTNLFH